MKRSDEVEPAAVIRIGGLSFPVWLRGGRISRLELPDLPCRSAGCGEGRSEAIIDLKNGRTFMGNRCLAELGEFLETILAGEEPAAPPPVSMDGFRPFAGLVLEAVAEIPWGVTRSYSWVAERVGRPGAARAVGGAVGSNPVPLLLPCHRVIRSNGAIGGWSGKPGWKEWLLELEAS